MASDEVWLITRFQSTHLEFLNEAVFLRGIELYTKLIASVANVTGK